MWLGTGALTIQTNDGGRNGDYSFSGKGRVAFGDTHGSLIVNGTAYTLFDKALNISIRS